MEILSTFYLKSIDFGSCFILSRIYPYQISPVFFFFYHMLKFNNFWQFLTQPESQRERNLSSNLNPNFKPVSVLLGYIFRERHMHIQRDIQ